MLRLLPFLRRMRHGMTLGVRVLAADEDGRIVLVRHTYLPGWHLPGGGVDVGETALEAARRELMEETNVTLTGPLMLHGVFFNPKVGGRDHVVCYRADHFQAGPLPAPNLEIAQVGFFAKNALPEDVSPSTARRIAEWQTGTAPSEHW